MNTRSTAVAGGGEVATLSVILSERSESKDLHRYAPGLYAHYSGRSLDSLRSLGMTARGAYAALGMTARGARAALGMTARGGRARCPGRLPAALGMMGHRPHWAL